MISAIIPGTALFRLQERLHLLHVRLLGRDELLRKRLYLPVTAGVVVQMLCAFRDAHRVALNHHFGDF